MTEPNEKTEDTGEAKTRSFTETIEIAGSQVIDQIKALLKEGNIHRIRIKAKDGDFHLEMPVTVGVLVGGAVVLAAPWLAILGVIGGLISQVKIEVERDLPANEPEPPRSGES